MYRVRRGRKENTRIRIKKVESQPSENPSSGKHEDIQPAMRDLRNNNNKEKKKPGHPSKDHCPNRGWII